VADVLGAHLPAYRQRYALGDAERRAVADILRCRTASLGGHVEVCSACGFRRPAYNSCRNRHCPKCQGLRQARWVARRMKRVLPTHYFHVVFTLPAELHAIARTNRALVFDALLRSAAAALLQLGRDPKWLGQAAQLAVTTVLHTWSRELRFHPHVHCVVSGGGLALDGSRWVSAASDFLFPVHVLGALFRGKLLAAIEQARRDGRLVLPSSQQGRGLRRRLARLYDKSWVVYAKRPFGGPEQVHRYLGRYTHRVAISNARLVTADDDSVTFRTRGQHTVTLSGVDFVRRFLDHVLPKAFVKIRHYGLLASGNVRSRLARARALLSSADDEGASNEAADDEAADDDLDWPVLLLRLTGIDLRLCPRCRRPTLQRRPLGPILDVARGPPWPVEAAA
jgi:Putative transposase/Transposase zinc-binding domain